MKVYSIGREEGCDIIINDNSDVISRRHATLNVSPLGKMTIVDLSHNGTYVNGIRISQNVPVPVSRKDNVSFAHVARLDWNLIPNTSGNIIRWLLIGVFTLLIVIGGVWGFKALSTGLSTSSEGQPEPVAVDSVSLKEQQEKKEEDEKQMQDTIKKQVRQKNPKKTAPKKVETKKAEPKKEAPKKEQQEETNKRFR